MSDALKATEAGAKITCELWDGYAVEINTNLANDYDWVVELEQAKRDQLFENIVELSFALVGGKEVFNKTREYLIEQTGRFDVKALSEIVAKIHGALPKAGGQE